MPQATQWKRDICNVCCDACKPYVPCCIRSMIFEYQVLTAKDSVDGPLSTCSVKRFTLTNNVNGQEGPDWSGLQVLDSLGDNNTSFAGVVFGACTFGIDIPVEHIFCDNGSANFTAKIVICNHHINGLIPSNNFTIWVQPQHGGLSFGVSFGDGSIGQTTFFTALTPEPPVPIQLGPGGEHEFSIDFSFIDYNASFHECVDPEGYEVIIQGDNYILSGDFHKTCFKALNCDSGPRDQLPWTGGVADSCDNLFLCPPCNCTRDDPVGFAAFNGTDSYIVLTQDIPTLNVAFKLEAEICLHNVTTFWPIFGKEAVGGFLGMDNSDMIFANEIFATSWVPVLDTWFKFRFEFEQTSQLQYKLFIDDVEVLDVVGFRQNLNFINLGVFRHNDPGVIWGDFDMRFLKLQMGDAGNLVTALEMPLIENALDLSVNANHGTPFNMDLPST